VADFYTIVIRTKRSAKRIYSTTDEGAARFWYGRIIAPKGGDVLLFRGNECIEGDTEEELPPGEFEQGSRRYFTARWS
jgi:hypothetical protein